MEQIKINVRGIMLGDLMNKFKSVLNYKESKNEAILFCDYSDFDVPIGHNFTIVKDIKSQQLFSTMIKLKSVTQAYALPFESIPKGHKTICNFVFVNNDLQKFLSLLPVISNWYDSNNVLELFNEL